MLNVNARCPVTVNGSELMERLEKTCQENAFIWKKDVYWNQTIIQRKRSNPPA